VTHGKPEHRLGLDCRPQQRIREARQHDRDPDRQQRGTKLAHTITVPADATLVVASKDLGLCLTEAESIYATASVGGDLHIVACWKELS